MRKSNNIGTHGEKSGEARLERIKKMRELAKVCEQRIAEMKKRVEELDKNKVKFLDKKEKEKKKRERIEKGKLKKKMRRNKERRKKKNREMREGNSLL